MLPEKENYFKTVREGSYYIPAIREDWEKEEGIFSRRKQRILRVMKTIAWILGVIAFIVLGIVVLSEPFL